MLAGWTNYGLGRGKIYYDTTFTPLAGTTLDCSEEATHSAAAAIHAIHLNMYFAKLNAIPKKTLIVLMIIAYNMYTCSVSQVDIIGFVGVEDTPCR